MQSVLLGCGLFVFSLFLLAPLTVNAEEGQATSSLVILEMADGRFYHPASGLVADTRKDLMNLLFPSPAPSLPDPVTPPLFSPATSSLVLSPLRDAVTRARESLSLDLPKKYTVNAWDGWGKVRLAVWDSISNEILFVDVMKNGTRLKILTKDWEIPLKVARTNGVNSLFELDAQHRYVVVAEQYPLYVERVISKKKKVYDVETVVYTPYSPAIHRPEIVAWGKETMQSIVDQAYQELDAKQIRSWAFPEKLLTQTVDPKVAQAVSIIEHVDHSALEKNTEATMEKFLIILATNQERSYAYSRSTANARGLAQFIPSTYKTLVKQRPEMGLHPDFVTGMQDTHNATKAQVAYLDQLISALPGAARAEYANELQRPRIHEYIVAAYNGGPSRVKKAMAEWDEQWSPERQAQIRTLEKKSASLSATINSLNKKIKQTKVAATKTKLKKELSKATKDRANIQAQLTGLKAKTLKQETLTYILKYRKVMEALGGQVKLVNR